MKGSGIECSGWVGGEGGGFEAVLVGDGEDRASGLAGWESSRITWVIVGWKGPPSGEWARRWVGRHWPREKKVQRDLVGWVVLA